ncbi:MAG: hypothetical protein Q4C70_15105, partial [Planctomycetia bacterium]|nr:hypothetical protein [Planctomycetia bacterium]
ENGNEKNENGSAVKTSEENENIFAENTDMTQNETIDGLEQESDTDEGDDSQFRKNIRFLFQRLSGN